MTISKRLRKKLDQKRRHDAIVRDVFNRWRQRTDAVARERVRQALEGWVPHG